MRWTTRSLPTLAVAALLGAGATLAPDAAAAQGRGHNDKSDKHLEKRDQRVSRDRRYDVLYDDDRRDDRRGVLRGTRRSAASIPRGHMPPAGMCRIWIDGVPPGRQPRATDCATARRNAPSNSRIVYGPRTGGRYDDRYDDRYDARNDGRYGVYDRGDVYDRDGDGDYDSRDQAIRRRDEVLRGGTSGSTGCVDRNRDGRCDW